MIQALLFDVFGTVVDWRSGISKDFELISKKYGIKCQRSFEIDESDFVVGYSSKGCF